MDKDPIRNSDSTSFVWNGGTNLQVVTLNTSSEEVLMRLKKQQEIDAFYATYDVWTGIRTAITLTLFFFFTVAAIFYKSKCKRHKHYDLNPSLEDIPNPPLDFYDYWCPTPVGGNISPSSSCKVYSEETLRRLYDEGPFESFGAVPGYIYQRDGSYVSLGHPIGFKSLPGSAIKINMSRMGSSDHDDISHYTVPSFRSEYLRVPSGRMPSFRSSSDGNSFESSFDIPLDVHTVSHLAIPGPSVRGKTNLQVGGIDWECDTGASEWDQTIDINVIQPTPNVSPCGSMRSVIEHVYDRPTLGLPQRSRAASLGSSNLGDYDATSVGSDSVFIDEPLSSYDNVPSRPPSAASSIVFDRSVSLDTGKRNSDYLSPDRKSPSGSAGRQVHSFRLPIRPVSPSSPMPHILQGSNLQKKAKLTNYSDSQFSLSLPLSSHLSSSCERLTAHQTLVSESLELTSDRSSTSTLNPVGSLDEDPVIATFSVPHVRRCNSDTNPETIPEPTTSRFRRTESENAPKLKRVGSAGERGRKSSGSSSDSDEITESLSFHLMVPHLSIDIASGENSRASTPSSSPSPPGSPMFGTSLSVPMHVQRSVSPSRGRGRTPGTDGRGVLKRQYSQYMPISPRDKSPSPFGLPTSFEEEEEELEVEGLPKRKEDQNKS